MTEEPMRIEDLPENVKQAVAECTPPRWKEVVVTVAERGLEGGAGGALIGSALPGIGTGAGLLIGEAAGGAEGLVEGGINALKNQPDTTCLIETLATGTNVSPNIPPSASSSQMKKVK